MHKIQTPIPNITNKRDKDKEEKTDEREKRMGRGFNPQRLSLAMLRKIYHKQIALDLMN